MKTGLYNINQLKKEINNIDRNCKKRVKLSNEYLKRIKAI